MPGEPPDEFTAARTALRAKSQAYLREFLSVELEFAFTLLNTARGGANLNRERSRALLAKVEEAQVRVRGLLGKIDNPQVQEELRSRVDELEHAQRSVAVELAH